MSRVASVQPLSLTWPVRPSCVARQVARVTVALTRGEATVATWSLDHPAAPDMATVDRLAHWQLEAQRAGYRLRLVRPSARLVEVMQLAGLAKVFELGPAGPASVAGAPEGSRRPSVQVGGQPEGGEVLFPEEVVDPGDAAG
jgi:hypothetical protein